MRNCPKGAVVRCSDDRVAVTLGLRIRRGAAISSAGALVVMLSVVAINFRDFATGVGAATPRNTIPPTAFMTFGDVPLGTYFGPRQHWSNGSLLISTGQTTTIDLATGVTQSGPGAGDYTLVPSTGCLGVGTTAPSRCQAVPYASWRSTSLPVRSEIAPPP